jgi:hypothetical protein
MSVVVRLQEIMATHRFELDFSDDQKSDLPHNPIAQVYLKSFGSNADGVPLISRECVSMRELDHEIDELKSELDVIRKKARVKFAADDRRQNERAGVELT